MIGTLFLSACGGSQSEMAVCVGSRDDRRTHAAALIEDGGPVSQASGAALLSKIKAGCSE